MGTTKGLAVAGAGLLAVVMFSGVAWAEHDASKTTVTEDDSFEELPDGSTVSKSVVIEITETPGHTVEFGEKGQLALGIERLGGFSWSKQALTNNNAELLTESGIFGAGERTNTTPTSTQFTLFVGGPENTVNAGLTMPRFAIDYFVTKAFSVGIGAIFGYKSDPNTSVALASQEELKDPPAFELDLPLGLNFVGEEKRTVFGAQIRAGYAFKITEWLSWWPRAGGEFLWSHETYNGTATAELKASIGGAVEIDEKITRQLNTVMNYTGVWFAADAPFVFSPAPGWAVTVAPTLDVPLLGKVTAEANGQQIPINGPNTARNNKVLNVGAFLGAVGYW
jgi:hypothetical protein